MACSPGNSQPWTFLIITDDAQKRRVAEIYRSVGIRAIQKGALASGVLSDEEEKVYQNAMILVDNLQNAPALILCCLEAGLQSNKSPQPERSPQSTGIQQSTYYGSIYPAIQNLMLAARSKGIGSTMTTLHKAREQDIKTVLGIPDDIDTIALIPLGYPLGKWGRPKRKPPHAVTFWNNWGETSGVTDATGDAKE